MNRISLILNIVLLLAVGVLYGLHFSSNKEVVQPVTEKTVLANTDSLAKKITVTGAQKMAPIVYLNIDTLFEKYEYYKKVNEEAKNMMKNHEARYEQLATKLQTEYADYMEKAGKGLYTKEQGMKIEEGLKKMKVDLDKIEMESPDVQIAAGKKLEVVQKKLYDFFKSYSAANGFSCILTYNLKGEGALGINDSLDVTNAVVKGLNDEYRTSLKK